MHMKKLFFIVCVSVLSISCDKISIETVNAFSGEYWMETSTKHMKDGEVIDSSCIWSPVSIYKKGETLYVQTECFGEPDTISENPKEMELFRERPKNIPFSENDSIETTQLPEHPIYVVIGGMIVCINHGIRVKSLPIQVESGSETVLNLKKFKAVNIQLIDPAFGESVQTIQAWYNYNPIVKNGNLLTWDIEFRDNGENMSREFDYVIHKNILYRR